MKRKTSFKIKDFVCLITDPEQKVRRITGILFRDTSHQYELSLSEATSYHFGYEMVKVVMHTIDNSIGFKGKDKDEEDK